MPESGPGRRISDWGGAWQPLYTVFTLFGVLTAAARSRPARPNRSPGPGWHTLLHGHLGSRVRLIMTHLPTKTFRIAEGRRFRKFVLVPFARKRQWEKCLVQKFANNYRSFPWQSSNNSPAFFLLLLLLGGGEFAHPLIGLSLQVSFSLCSLRTCMIIGSYPCHVVRHLLMVHMLASYRPGCSTHGKQPQGEGSWEGVPKEKNLFHNLVISYSRNLALFGLVMQRIMKLYVCL